MEYCGAYMWRIMPSECWLHDLHTYSDAKADSVAAVLINLARYLKLLKASAHSNLVEAGYLEQESENVLSIKQLGVGSYEDDLRIYVYPDDSRRTLCLLCLGKAEDKNSDMEYSNSVVHHLMNRKPETSQKKETT